MDTFDSICSGTEHIPVSGLQPGCAAVWHTFIHSRKRLEVVSDLWRAKLAVRVGILPVMPIILFRSVSVGMGEVGIWTHNLSHCLNTRLAAPLALQDTLAASSTKGYQEPPPPPPPSHYTLFLMVITCLLHVDMPTRQWTSKK